MALNTTFVSGNVLTAAQMNNLPFGVAGVAKRTAGDVTISGAVQDITGMSITFTALTGRLYKASWLCVGDKNASDRDQTTVQFTDSANTVISAVPMITMSGSNIGINFSACTYFTASTGSVTYKLRALSFSGSLIVNGTSTEPCVLIIEDIGLA